MPEFKEAVGRVVAGLEKKNRLINPNAAAFLIVDTNAWTEIDTCGHARLVFNAAENSC